MPRFRVTAQPGGACVTLELRRAFAGENIAVVTAPTAAEQESAVRAAVRRAHSTISFVVQACDSAAVNRAAERVRLTYRTQPAIDIEACERL